MNRIRRIVVCERFLSLLTLCTRISGLDMMDMASVIMLQQEDQDVSRRAYYLRDIILEFQESFSVIEKCPQPVIAAVHSACVGGGVDMICACDIRWCTTDSWFQIKVRNSNVLKPVIQSSDLVILSQYTIVWLCCNIKNAYFL